MNSAEAFFDNVRSGLLHGEEVSERKFFGFRSLVICGKNFVILFENSLVFKLDENSAKDALALRGSSRWNPYGQQKKNWIQFSKSRSASWNSYFSKAAESVIWSKGREK